MNKKNSRFPSKCRIQLQAGYRPGFICDCGDKR